MNLKKGQFVAPKDIVQSAKKAFEAGNPNVLVTERGASFGYNNLVVDMRGFAQMREAGLAVCFDATHSVQLPSAGGDGQTAGSASSCRCSRARPPRRASTRSSPRCTRTPTTRCATGPAR